MKRGSIVSNDNNFYMLVRIESGVTGTDPNGKKVDMKFDRYNLVNLGTGKTRVSEPERMYLVPSPREDVLIDGLRAHFNMPNLQDTGISAEDVNFGAVIAQAIQEKKLRGNLTVVASNDATTNLLMNLLTQLGVTQ